ncbi:MAG: aminotransferase class IV [Clostridiales bacterium]|nr:aminotransferase class IV [Clostridiales bacterium]
MGYPLVEHPVGAQVFVNGSYFAVSSPEVAVLQEPYDKLAYYETIRLMDKTPLFWEEHLERLSKSVSSDLSDSITLEGIVEDIKDFLTKVPNEDYRSLRIVASPDYRVIHYVDITLPTEEDFKSGISAASLLWERQDPNIKAFRGDYKAAVAAVFDETEAFEVVLADNDGRLYEGSKSNFFAIVDGAVYSAPDDKILIGITRRRVMEALDKEGIELKIGTFTLNELKESGAALFVSSTPFDILPIASVDGVEFSSADNAVLKRIMSAYAGQTAEYITDNKFWEA